MVSQVKFDPKDPSHLSPVLTPCRGNSSSNTPCQATPDADRKTIDYVTDDTYIDEKLSQHSKTVSSIFLLIMFFNIQ